MTERILGDGVREKVRLVGRFVGTVFGKSKFHIEAQIGRYVVDGVERLTEINPQGQDFKDSFKDLASKGYIPIFFTTHQTLVDGHVVAFIADNFRKEGLFNTDEY